MSMLETPRKGVKLVAEHVSKQYGDTLALKDICLEVPPGSLLTLLGPSGCGKSTLLRIIAGFLGVSAGRILVDGIDISGVDPSHRETAMVFQNYALFPHMTVMENVMFGLRMRRIPKQQAREKAIKALDMVRLLHLEDRVPAQLSGGQQQRAALARALVTEPKVLLLDEPFGALDKSLREEMQVELRKLQKRVGVTTICVTHDQQEAMAISDYIAVMNHGVLEQCATPLQIYDAPTSRFVATFIGSSNIFSGHLAAKTEHRSTIRLSDNQLITLDKTVQASVGDPIELAVRPGALRLVQPGEAAPSNVLAIDGKIVFSTNLGNSVTYEVETTTLGTLFVEQTRRQSDVLRSAGDSVRLVAEQHHCIPLER